MSKFMKKLVVIWIFQFVNENTSDPFFQTTESPIVQNSSLLLMLSRSPDPNTHESQPIYATDNEDATDNAETNVVTDKNVKLLTTAGVTKTTKPLTILLKYVYGAAKQDDKTNKITDAPREFLTEEEENYLHLEQNQMNTNTVPSEPTKSISIEVMYDETVGNVYTTTESVTLDEGRMAENGNVCLQGRHEGRCGENLPRWYYNVWEHRCTQFYYTGCHGNSNRFVTLEECEKTCHAALLSESDGCLDPVSVGDCAAYTERYYFDRFESKCKTFIFSGCGGNRNNFVAVDDCHAKCMTFPLLPVATSEEKQFSQAQCFVPPPDDPNSCSDPNQTPTIRWYYDNHDGVCYQFRYYCSNSSLNNFETRQDCKDKCETSQDVCGLPVILGPCSGQFLQYYYDYDSDACQSFEYSGCLGNGNRFDTVVQCEQRCKNITDNGHVLHGVVIEGVDVEDQEGERIRNEEIERRRTEEDTKKPLNQNDVCSLAVDQGPCRNAVWSYYFDTSTGKCTKFLYGGCGGNANRFESEEMCEQRCSKLRGQDACRLTVDPGTCIADSQRSPMWYFNSNDQVCSLFVYSGCGGNGNRFSSRDECESVCHSRSRIIGSNDTITGAAICRLRPDTGPCTELSKRFYYNFEKKTCIPFVYGGCAGNLNRFKSFDTCINFCEKALGYTHRKDDGVVINAKVKYLNESEGGVAELECIARGNLRLSIVWAKVGDNERITGMSGRFRIKAHSTPTFIKSTLQIIGLLNTDTGKYVCAVPSPSPNTPPTQEEITLHIYEHLLATKEAASVREKPILPTTQLVNLGQTANLGCLAQISCWPITSVTWRRGERMLPFSSERYEQMKDYSLEVRMVDLRDLGVYTCQAYDILGRTASWNVSLLANGPVKVDNDEDREYLSYVVDSAAYSGRENYNRVVQAPCGGGVNFNATTARNVVGPHRVVQHTTSAAVDYNERELEGEWNGYREQEKTSNDSPDFVISKGEPTGSGTYHYETTNDYAHSTTSMTLKVDEVKCTDKSLFANCELIVKANYCANKYYTRFCCKSCTLAGQLPTSGPHVTSH